MDHRSITPGALRKITDKALGAEAVAKAEALFKTLLENAIVVAQQGGATVSLPVALQKEHGPLVMEAVNEMMVVRGFTSRGSKINPFGRNHGQAIYWWGW